MRLGGVFESDAAHAARWSWAGAWLYPVGSPFDFQLPDSSGAPGFAILRTVERRPDGSVSHQGADLGNRRGGDAVRAAANGIVVHCGWQDGYGHHVVLAHQLGDGTFAYSVYAHLLKGSTLVHEGECIGAGTRLGRVGRSGRATTEHLHFEVRRPRDPLERWENSRVVEPLDFCAERLPEVMTTPEWAEPYLVWAQLGALIERGDRPLQSLRRAQWWGMLGRAARHDLAALPVRTDSLRAVLIAQSLLPEDAARDGDAYVRWPELARDVARLKDAGLRLPALELDMAKHREVRTAELGASAAGSDGARLNWADPDRAKRAADSHAGRGAVARLERGDSDPPSIADACLACADLCVTKPARHPKPHRRKHDSDAPKAPHRTAGPSTR